MVKDHLDRNDTAHQVFTNVEYKLPAEIAGMNSDFDVLVQAGEILTAFEAKGGYLFSEPSTNGRSRGAQKGAPNEDLKKVIEHAEVLKEVIVRTGSDV